MWNAKLSETPRWTKSQLKRFRDFQQLSPDQRFRWMYKANHKFLRSHPEVLKYGLTVSEAIRAYCAAKHKRLELEVIRDRRGRRSLRVIQVKIPEGISWY